MSSDSTRRSIAIAWFVAAACASPEPDRADSVTGDRAGAIATVPAAEPRDSSVLSRADTMEGGLRLWNTANLEKRLDLQGMAPQRLPDPVRHSFLSVTGTAYTLGNAELQVFIYPNTAAAARDVAPLDTVSVSPPSERIAWGAKATLITNRNLAAILLSDNALQIERVQRALMAGLSPE